MNQEPRPLAPWSGRQNGLNEKLVAIFLLALALFNPPLLAVFGVPASFLGLPILYLYLFVAWAGVILALALAMERTPDETPEDRGPGGAGQAGG
ncbi:MAG: hypothetical protein KIT20_12450 [Alphaproteobacteria bacterium]|nr:hypothetical protein [Alphaproteobacteria bacterium]